jgi:error-prone DNA polymerase
MYAELCCRSNFSFLRAASHPQELVERAAALNYRALAITDECSLAGMVRAWERARALNFKLIVGSEFALDDCRLVVLAENLAGYQRLSTLITRCRRRCDKGEYAFKLEDIDRPGIDRLADCSVILLAKEQEQWSAQLGLSQARIETLLQWLENRLWLGCSLLLGPDDKSKLQAHRLFAQHCQIPLTACGQVLMHRRHRRALLDVLMALSERHRVEDSPHHRPANAEQHLRSLQRLERIYPADLLAESERIAARCQFQPSQLQYRYPEEITPPGFSTRQWLRHEVEAGIKRRWPEACPEHVRQQIEHELGLIADMAYEPYFLTVYDIVLFARQRGILCQGRGSAANSAVCFALGITEVDPSRGNLLFERFISRERNEPPDIDIDFEHERREEVMQYVYRRYGRHRAALAATVVHYHYKGAVRDVGRAMGLEAGMLDRLANATARWDRGETIQQRLDEAGIDCNTPRMRQVLALTEQLIGFPRHLSQHVGGFVISQPPLSQLVPLENAAMADRTIIQWDKDDLETLGLMKIDCLALGMLSALRRALDMREQWRGERWTLANIPAEDGRVYDMLGRGQSTGVFQVESRAQMAMLARLKPRHFYDLVIEVAIVRPGPIQGDMVHPYLRRREAVEPTNYPSEGLRQVLERTLGVPIFQEQVMQIAMVAGGFSAGEADRLRRAMAAWKRRGGLEPFRERLMQGMAERGYDPAFAERIFEQIRGFGQYGFPESHAASFALLVYASAWLKCHEPAIFCAALINSQPMGFYTPSQLIQEARRQGVEIRPLDINASHYDCTLERVANNPQPAIRLGLRLVKGLSRKSIDRLLHTRQHGHFRSVEDLLNRCPLDKRERRLLAASDALRRLAGHRHRAQWQVQANVETQGLFRHQPRTESAVQLSLPGVAEEVFDDYQSTGLSLRQHPMQLLRPRLRRESHSRKLLEARDKQWLRVTGLVTNRQRPGTAKGTLFLTLEDEFGTVNVIVWPALVEHFRRVVLSASVLCVSGQLQHQGDVRHLVARHLLDRSADLAGLRVPSRDFH